MLCIQLAWFRWIRLAHETHPPLTQQGAAINNPSTTPLPIPPPHSTPPQPSPTHPQALNPKPEPHPHPTQTWREGQMVQVTEKMVRPPRAKFMKAR
jgi:hypothetical protein